MPKNKHQFLDQIFKFDKNYSDKPEPHEEETLLTKGKEIASKGEDFLVDSLGLDDNEETRNALRKGVGVGAAAGALAILMASRSGRNLVKIGGIAGLGTLAYKAYQKNGGTEPEESQGLIQTLKGEQAEKRTTAILKAMVGAAKADGHISMREKKLINSYNQSAKSPVKEVLNSPTSFKLIASLVDSQQAAREIYAAAARVANGINKKEREYLDNLARCLKLDPEIAARLETDVRTGS